MPAAQTTMENCVSHLPSLVPVPGRDVITQAWYQAGVSVIDFTDSANPKEIGYYDPGPISGTGLVLGGLWSSYYYNGRIFGSEIARGFDVWNLTPTAELSANEITAASEVQFDRLTPQHQTQFTIQPSFAVVRSYRDQLERAGRGRQEDARPDRQVHRSGRGLRQRRTAAGGVGDAPRAREPASRTGVRIASGTRLRRWRTHSDPAGEEPASLLPGLLRDTPCVTLLADVVAASQEVAATSSRSRKVAALAELLRRLEPDEVPIAVGFLSGAPRQGRVGVGYATVFGARAGAGGRAVAHGRRPRPRDRRDPGGDRERLRGRRQEILVDLLGRATAEEADFVRRLLTGELRQGALAGLMVDAIAKAADVSGDLARRALMLSGDLTRTAELALARRRGRAARGRLRALPADPADARLHRRERRRGGRELRARVGRVEARRHPHPDPPPRRRGPHLHAQPQRHHGRAARDRRRGARGCRCGRRCSTARRCGWASDGPARVPGHGLADRRRGAAGGRRDVPLRRAARRRRRPARHAARRARRAARRRSRRSCRSRACSPPIRTRAQRVLDEALRAGPRGRGGQGRRLALRGRAARQGVAQGEAGADLRPRRARRRVGPRPAAGLALEPAPGRPRPATGGVRDGRQDASRA